MQYHIAHAADITFLVEKEAKAAANKAKAKKTSNWIDNDPFLCLYHCLINDTVKSVFLPWQCAQL
jgi:hypothetical protein